MVHYSIWEPIKKWSMIVPRLGLHFCTLGTSFVKFGTSNPNATRIAIFSPMVHYVVWEPIRNWLDQINTSRHTVEPLVHHLENLVHLIPMLSKLPMVHYFIWEPIRKSLEVNPHLRTHFGTLSTFFIKFSSSFVKFGTSNPNATRTPMLSPMLH